MKTNMAFGVGIGVAIFVLTLLCYLSGLHDKYIAQGIYVAYLAYAIGFTGLWLAIREAKRKQQQGPFSYGRALGAGAAVTVFWALTAAIGSYVYLAYINPDFGDQLLKLQVAKMEAKGLNSQQIETASNIMRMLMRPLPNAIGALIGYIFVGTAFSLIIAAFLKSPTAKNAGS